MYTMYNYDFIFYITTYKFVVSKIFLNVFESSDFALQGWINIFYFNIFWNVIYSHDAKLNFQHHYSSLQCHMILQKSF